jgi:hypothetical protein
MVLNAICEASKHWQLINVPSHVLADNSVIFKSKKKQKRFKAWFLKGTSRTEQDDVGAIVSDDPQKAVLLAFCWFWSSELHCQSGITTQINMYA